MKLLATILTLTAYTLAQRLHITSPRAGTTLPASEFFTLTLTQDQSLGPLQPGTITVSATPCHAACASPDKWGPGTVLYAGKFRPRARANHTQSLRVRMPDFGAPTGVALAVAHEFRAGGATLVDVFDYTEVVVDVQ